MYVWSSYGKRFRHYLRDFREFPEGERNALLKELAEERRCMYPLNRQLFIKPPPEQLLLQHIHRRSEQHCEPQRTVPRKHSSSFTVSVADGNETITSRGRTDDGSDENFTSSLFAERAVLNGISKMEKFDKVVLQVALKDGWATQIFYVFVLLDTFEDCPPTCNWASYPRKYHLLCRRCQIGCRRYTSKFTRIEASRLRHKDSARAKARRT